MMYRKKGDAMNVQATFEPGRDALKYCQRWDMFPPKMKTARPPYQDFNNMLTNLDVGEFVEIIDPTPTSKSYTSVVKRETGMNFKTSRRGNIIRIYRTE